jgi:hypothetical protein
MFEIGIFCIIALAMGYWTTLWLVGRREDVLHGDFVQAEQRAEAAPAPAPVARVASTDTLQSLLASIKQDLKDAAQI